MKKLLVLLALLPLAAFSGTLGYSGDWILGDKVQVDLDSFSAAGAKSTLSGLASSDIKIYRACDGGAFVVTERGNTSGYTLIDTDGIDVGGLTGWNAVEIDTSNNTSATWNWAAGCDYFVSIGDVTIDSQTVRATGRFSIENRAGTRDRIKARGNMVSGSSTTVIQLATGTLPGSHAWQGMALYNATKKETATICDSADGGAGNDTLTVSGLFTTPGATDAYQIIRTDLPASCIASVVGSGLPLINQTTGAVVVDRAGQSGAMSPAWSDKMSSNLNTTFDNGNAVFSGTISAISAAAIGAFTNIGTPLNTASGATIAANTADLFGAAHVGVCDSMSTTTTCNNSSLTEADDFWNGWTAIIVAGEPPRCVRLFKNSTHRLTFSPALPSTAASKLFVLRAEPSCRIPP
jgi:hypothetical protein